MDTKYILVVEDDPILKNLLGHTLADKYKTVYASDGNEALSLLEQYKPVLILLDLMLPTMDGFAVLQTIRARTDELRDVPIVVVSNLGADADKQKARVLGANDYLIKAEVAVEEIVAKIQGMLPADAVLAQSATPPVADASVAPAVLTTGEIPADMQSALPTEMSGVPPTPAAVSVPESAVVFNPPPEPDFAPVTPVVSAPQTPVTAAPASIPVAPASPVEAPPPFLPMYGVGEGELPIQPAAPQQPVQPQAPSTQPPVA